MHQKAQNMKLGNAVLVASTGGHLEQLTRFVRSETIQTDRRVWVTFDHPQSADLLRNEQKVYVDYIPSRGIFQAIKSLPAIIRTIRSADPDTVISTGAAIAVPAALAARVCKKPFIYLESVSRFDGPSLTGRIMQWLPFVSKYTQHHHWADQNWKPGPSVLGDFVARKSPSPKRVERIFISLGTIKPYRFDRAIHALQRTIPHDVEVRLQHGCTTGTYPHWISKETISTAEFNENIEWADLVILHAGVGSALNILDRGKVPVLLVREASRGEHVDDHQAQIAKALSDRNLAVVPSLEELTWEKLTHATEFVAAAVTSKGE